MKRPFTTLATAIMCLLAGASVHAGRPGVDPDGEDPACGPTTAHVHRPLAGGPATTEDRRSQPAAPTSIDPFPAGAGLRHTTVAGFDFFPLMDAQAYLKGPSIPMLHGGLLSGTSGAVFEAELDLPHRAQLHRVDILGLQTHAEGALAVSVVERCLPYREGGNPEETLLVSAVIPDQGGGFIAGCPLGRHLVDAARCSYHVRARFGDFTGPVPGLEMQLGKVRIEWLPDRIFADGLQSG